MGTEGLHTDLTMGGGAPQTGSGYGGPTYRPDYGGGLPKLGLGTEDLHTDLTMGGGASPNWAWVRRTYIQT